MPISVVMPALEMAQETGKLVSWRKKNGELVTKGEVLLEIETDKAVMEIEAPGSGILAGVKAQEGDVIPVGQTIAWLLGEGESIPEQTEVVASQARAFTESSSKAAIAAKPVAVSETVEIKASPKARRLAKEKGVDLGKLRGSGPGGEILASDILAAAEATPSHAAEGLSAVARLMAERTTQSWTTVPHFFIVREVDATALNRVREISARSFEKAHGVKPTHTDFLVSSVAKALRKHPRMNSSWRDGSIQENPEVNIGIAVAVADGVVTAVIANADRLEISGIAQQRRDLVERAKAGKLRPSDIAGATFTISNLGMFDVDAFSAIITPPQAAILAVGRIADRVIAVDGNPAVRPMMALTLSTDHRVADGARAAAFLSDVVNGLLSVA
jgi:pyruvate dehydrogenase E2 component (dihydrolipoamide acetyltransferase)